VRCGEAFPIKEIQQTLEDINVKLIATLEKHGVSQDAK
jgi:hypothetical protein